MRAAGVRASAEYLARATNRDRNVVRLTTISVGSISRTPQRIARGT